MTNALIQANHDRERNGALNWQMPALETLATVFMLGTAVPPWLLLQTY